MSKKLKNVPITVVATRDGILAMPDYAYYIINRNVNLEDENDWIIWDEGLSAKKLKARLKEIRNKYPNPSGFCIHKVSKKRIRRIKRRVRKIYTPNIGDEMCGNNIFHF